MDIVYESMVSSYTPLQLQKVGYEAYSLSSWSSSDLSWNK